MTLGEWLNKPDAGICKPCLLSPLAAWYVETLKEEGAAGLAESLKQNLTKTDSRPEEAARQMDSIRVQICEARPKLCKLLTDLDEGMFSITERDIMDQAKGGEKHAT